MPLSAEELKTARKAFQDVQSHARFVRQFKRGPVTALTYLLVFLGMVAAFLEPSFHTAEVWAGVILPILIINVVEWHEFQRLKSTCAEDLQMLEQLRCKSEGYSPPTGLIPEATSLLEYWTPRMEPYGILWRMRRFLGQKPISA